VKDVRNFNLIILKFVEQEIVYFVSGDESDKIARLGRVWCQSQ